MSAPGRDVHRERGATASRGKTNDGHPGSAKRTRVFCTHFDLTDDLASRPITTGTDDVRFPLRRNGEREWEGDQ